jgi:hypothetical protein
MGAGSRCLTRQEALAYRSEMLVRAKYMACIAADTRLPWGIRYHAAVAGDDCLDVAKMCDDYIKEHG